MRRTDWRKRVMNRKKHTTLHKVGDPMIKRDAGQDGDRAHFYSQYWIDVAQGKPTSVAVATEPAAADDELDLEDELAAPRAARPEPAPKATKPAKAPEKKPEPAKLSSLADLANIDLLMKNSAELDDDVAPDLASGYQPVDAGVTLPVDAPLGDVEETEPEMESLEEYEANELEYDEDEEDDEWGSQRGKKKPTQRRERRRDY
jgi:hypothetical protein